MGGSKLSSSTFIALIRASNSLTSETRMNIKAMGLTVSQFGVLEALYHHKQLTNKDLSKKILKVQGNLTMVIDNLIKQELVERAISPNDRRAIAVSLTSKGKNLIKKILPKHLLFIDKLLMRLSADEKKQLIKICKKLTTTET